MDFSEIFIKMLVGLFKRFTDHSWFGLEMERKNTDGAFAEMITKTSCEKQGTIEKSHLSCLGTGWYYMMIVNLSVRTGLELSKKMDSSSWDS